MKKYLIFLSIVFGFVILQSQASNLPDCKGGYWTNCFGTYTYPNGDTYIGEHKDNKEHGQGSFTWASGSMYIGEWRKGKTHGFGTYTYASGDKYVGEFKDNKRHGLGTFIWANGDKYVGEYKHNERDGEGVYTPQSGEVKEGIWKDGKFQYAKKISPKSQINIPDNAFASGDSWKCKSGYEQSGNICKKKPEPKKEIIPEEVLQAASGTGFIVSKEGHIVTNHHVIEGCKEVKVHKDGDVYKGKVLAKDKINDLALIKSNFKPNVIFPLSDKNPSILQPIFVAGFPFGNVLSSSVKVTQGIVSSETGIGNNYSNIQIDAALQPGNSGGPILDKKGNVVAVAVAKLAMEKIYEDFGVFPENTNFGIKSSVVESLIQTHNIKNPSPYTEEMSINDLGYNIKQATLYLSCWMTLAQIKKFSTKKVIFRDLVN